MTTALDTLLATVRANACLAGPLATSGDLYADGGGSAHTLTAMMAPASETVQMQQGQGVLEGRRATLMLSAAAVTTAISRALRRGDEFRISSGEHAGTWVVEDANPVRGGWNRADVRLERMAETGPMREVR
jgi:hypothetical protein